LQKSKEGKGTRFTRQTEKVETQNTLSQTLTSFFGTRES